LIAKTLNRFGRAARRYFLTGRFRSAPGPIIERFFGGRDCFFVQVGSNDGVRGDPLHKVIKANPNWRGLFVEPLDEAFELLASNYPNDGRFAFEHVAISDSCGEQWLYYVSLETIRELRLPVFPGAGLHGVASLSREHVLRNIIGLKYVGVTLEKDPGSYISRKLVRCETLASVLERNRVSRIDVFHVDAEGHDNQIIRQIDFERFSPTLILYERSGDEDDATAPFLSSKGYRLIHCGDMLAVRRIRGKARRP
jgi:FkbM family methyltransferase